jgi:hypothetical protein
MQPVEEATTLWLPENALIWDSNILPLSGKAWSRTRGSPSPRSLYDIATPDVL